MGFTDLDFADDAFIFAETMRDLVLFLEALAREAECLGLHVSCRGLISFSALGGTRLHFCCSGFYFSDFYDDTAYPKICKRANGVKRGICKLMFKNLFLFLS